MVQSNTGSDGKGMTTEVTSTGLKSNYRTAAKEIYAWLQAHKKEGIIIEAGNNDGLEVHVDSDWGGMHSVCGEVRSRSGVLVRVNKVPVYWKSSLQKVTSTQFDPELDPDTVRLHFEDFGF